MFFFVVLGCSMAWAQSSPAAPSSGSQTPANSQAGSSSSQASKLPPPNTAPPRSDRVHASDLGDEPGESSSKDAKVDLSPPADDDKAHPQSQDALVDERVSSGAGDVSEAQLWNPHKAAKDIEVGDFYFKKKNYRAAEDRYREALLYKQNDATATFRLAESLEKLDRPAEALREYESYLHILPNGPEAGAAKRALERLKPPATSDQQTR